LKAGYRHIDTAHLYGSEYAVGEAIRQSGIPREQFFVTTKLPWNHQGRVKESLDESLKNAGLDYYDLYLIHWPQVLAYEVPTANKDGLINIEPKNEDGSTKMAVNPPSLSQTWAEMEKVLATGKVKNIGVSNFSIKTLEPILKTAKVIPAVNQASPVPCAK
jgi:glycerol 2-dehydrogenase (NADP+)